MSETFFHQMADSEGWSETTQIDLLLRYISAQQDETGFADFLAQYCEADSQDVGHEAERFTREVAEHLDNQDLAVDPAFESFCGNAFDMLTSRQTAERWRRTSAK
ncbi:MULTISPECIES: hypothetical protein [Sphingobium]|jgi:uncharacterized protein YchJ|uniref:CdiI immunity protein domain-containing protein n=3 Tax=Sphingobium TaxID=165695 RepID=A0A6P1GEA8_SPHYA|nr:MULTISPECIES: hypothetical protein [Sphingobium]EQB16815.1 hypothetical protein RLDS_06770 [Sphingobium lactosutens DS20]QDC36653.1 hypothetical protein FIL70_04750 [Sphingobium fuliginis ATCC 27551]QHD66749.1 hypothetical protein GS397_06570 [Sphingobium yanoikuyae]QNG43862.1 hypothetical protein H3V42_18275 [Sphingobium yanoikuyae]